MTWENFFRNSPISSAPGFCFVLLVVSLENDLKAVAIPEKNKPFVKHFPRFDVHLFRRRRVSQVTDNTTDTRIIKEQWQFLLTVRI